MLLFNIVSWMVDPLICEKGFGFFFCCSICGMCGWSTNILEMGYGHQPVVDNRQLTNYDGEHVRLLTQLYPAHDAYRWIMLEHVKCS